jgi:hypothetical protein
VANRANKIVIIVSHKTYHSPGASSLGEFALFPEAAADAKVDGDMIGKDR